jgi:hypothetical protein
VQNFVPGLVNERSEFLGWRLAGQKSDATVIAHALGWRDGLVEFDFDALPTKKAEEHVPAFANLAGCLCRLGQFIAFGLGYIENVDGVGR